MKRRGIKLSLLGSISLLGIIGLSSCEVDLSSLGNVKISVDEGKKDNDNTESGSSTGTGTSTTGGDTGTTTTGGDTSTSNTNGASGTGTSGTTGTETGGNSGTSGTTGTETGGTSGTSGTTGTETGGTSGTSGTTGTETGGTSGTSGTSGTETGGSSGTSTGGTSGTGGSTSTTTHSNASFNGTYNYVEAPAAPSYITNGGEVDVYLNYNGTSGVHREGHLPTIIDPITGTQITSNTMLPTWKAFQSYTNTTIVDASTYTLSRDNDVWASVTNENFKSETDNARTIDIIYNSVTNFNRDADKLLALDDYIKDGKMPYFKAYLDKNPEVKKMLTQADGKIYYTPYFDSQDSVERMFMMDTALTKKVLDSASGWDTTTTNGGSNPSSNVVQGGYYQPFIDANYNYANDTKVKVLVNREVKEVTIKKTENIIKLQNQLLSVGCTGQELAQQFIGYINTAYKDLFDKEYYKNPSDLFVSSAAAYNTDDLIALMRVVKANPGMISGNANAEITTFFPRAASNSRIENVYDLAQIWGVQGVDGENGNFYIGGDGKVHALETTQASYDALEYLSQIYDEGLILNSFYTNNSGIGSPSSGFLDRFYRKTLSNSSYGFMMYDYPTATTASNDIYGGIGTMATARNNGFNTDYECQGITSVLAPLTYWATESSWRPSDNIRSRTGKTLTRYYESSRLMKNYSWAIPLNADNPEGAIRLMDIMFSELGQMVNNYGPVEYWAKPDTSKGDTVTGTYDPSKYYVADNLILGELNPIISTPIKVSISSNNADLFTCLRLYLGATHAIGNVRPLGLNLQATNYYGWSGFINVHDAYTVGNNGVIGNGEVLKLATNSRGNYTWNTAVPSGYTTKWNDADGECWSLTGFWAATKANNNTGWVNAVTRGHTNDISTVVVKNAKGFDVTYANVLEEIYAYNKKALYTYAFSIANDNTFVPSYALEV